jgi:hypothetical protein
MRAEKHNAENLSQIGGIGLLNDVAYIGGVGHSRIGEHMEYDMVEAT